MARSLIVIGAGLAGLSTGCYAQMNGYDSHIFEHHSKPGGVATAWKRKGYIFDGGIHFMMGCKPGSSTYGLYRELGIAQSNHIIGLSNYGRYVDDVSGRSLDITQDLNRLLSDIKAISPADFHIADDIIGGASAMRGLDFGSMGMDKSPELITSVDRFKQMWKMRRMLKYFSGRYAKPVAEYAQGVRDPWLRFVIENLFLPEVPVWFILILLGMLADENIGLLEKGSLELARSIEKRYKELGGQVTYKAAVEKILVKNDRAVGVRLSDGGEHYADAVVSAADGHSTIFEMLEGSFVDDKIRDRYKTWKLFRPMVMVNFGAAREFSGEPHLQIVRLDKPLVSGNRVTDAIVIRIFNYSTWFAPRGKTVLQVTFETEWDFWNRLQKDRLSYEYEKERTATETLECLEERLPGISSQIDAVDIATPYTTWRYTRNYHGSFEGWLPAPDTINVQIERTLPGLKNFYMAGQWVMPGGGVLPCLYSGRHVAQLLCQTDRKPFKYTVL